MNNAKTGALIAARRKALELTQKELAQQLHISDRTVSKWERGAGFPDISLLEPLADALDVSIVDLIQGEQIEAAVSEITVRSVISALTAHVRRTTRQQAVSILASAVLVLFSAGILFLMAESFGAFDEQVSMAVPVGVYMDGELVEEGTITVEGMRYRLSGGDYEGRFAVSCLPQTCGEATRAYIRWYDGGYSHISFYSVGPEEIPDEPLPYDLMYISHDMRIFAARLSDGRVLSTHASYVPLVMLDRHYPLDI